jgi:hypothetical protein
MIEDKEKSVEIRGFITPYQWKRVKAAAKNIGLPPEKKTTIIYMMAECFIKSYLPDEKTT